MISQINGFAMGPIFYYESLLVIVVSHLWTQYTLSHKKADTSLRITFLSVTSVLSQTRLITLVLRLEFSNFTGRQFVSLVTPCYDCGIGVDLHHDPLSLMRLQFELNWD